MKIAITQHPHFGVPQDLKGGDEVVNSLIKEILSASGYQVEYVLYDCRKFNSLLKLTSKTPVFYKITKKCLRMLIPVFYSIYLNRISNEYDVMICDSTVLVAPRPEKVINYFHGTYYGYRKRVGKMAFGLSEDIVQRILSFLQKRGALKTYNVVVSHCVKNDLDEIGIKTHKIIYNCVDTEKFKPNSEFQNRKGLLYAGGYAYYGKGFDVLERLAMKGIEITCVTNMPPPPPLKFVNSVPHAQMPEVYNRYKVLLYPSRSEACQMVPLEAMSCGLPVIISNTGFAPELKKEIPEFVVDGHDDNAVDEYFQKLKIILDNYPEYSVRAREYIIKKHSLEIFRREWLSAINEFKERQIIHDRKNCQQ